MHNVIKHEEHLVHIIRQMPSIAFWKRKDLTIAACSELSANHHGYTSETIIGLTDYDLKSEAANFADVFRNQAREVMESGTELRVLNFMRCSQKLMRLFIINKRPFYDESDNLIGVIGNGSEVVDSEVQRMIKLIIRNDEYYNGKQSQSNSYEIPSKKSLKQKKLTPRESECLFYMIRGYAPKQIAHFLDLQKRTVEYYIANMKNKFNFTSKSQLIDYGISMGYLNLLPERFLNSQVYTV